MAVDKRFMTVEDFFKISRLHLDVADQSAMKIKCGIEGNEVVSIDTLKEAYVEVKCEKTSHQRSEKDDI